MQTPYIHHYMLLINFAPAICFPTNVWCNAVKGPSTSPLIVSPLSRRSQEPSLLRRKLGDEHYLVYEVSGEIKASITDNQIAESRHTLLWGMA